ncbi:putative ADP-ribosylation factor-like 2, arl2 [Trypanosoma grayi]|uniref:putative ADP-ribosylation factor-like 2, arl2 n=1 Tax=Trypanosoma grayi TaxID=71804 RepID=UPI0004F4B22E|nr:putative ADP-ribosylation factor-like 2, arl2 [Trypanosoma grayi]KEG14596.1 putative ADP-ribosylation factor-like 2, arl2 [Trypanosoma grayi]
MEQQAQQEDNVMGVVRCAQEKGRASLMTYKKRFWVVDETQGRLEVYKNDQEPFPQAKFPASEVRGVIFSGGKQNKYFGLVLQLRRGRNVKFRLNSVTERDRWYTAITRLIERYSTYNRDQNVLRVAQRRTTVAERILGVSITLAVAKLRDIPDDLMQYLVEAVDVAIDTIAAVVHAYGGDMEIPRRYTVMVAAADSHTRTGPQYDPTTGSLVLQVWISRDILGHVRFSVAESSDIMKMTQSHVWRDPRIEGWITMNPSCVAVCREIGDLLGIKKPFSFSFQWGQNLRDTERVEQYLYRYVHEDFLRSVQRQIVEVAEDFKRSGSSSDDSLYIKYIGDYVSGIAITLDEETVNAGKPPELSVTTTDEYHRRCRHAVVMTSKYLEVYRQPRVVSKSLLDQLVDVILLADLSKRLSDSKASLSLAMGGKERVKVMWDNLLRSCARMGAPLLQRNLSHMVSSCSNVYLGRLERLQQQLSSPLPTNDGDRPYFETIFKNVVSIVVDFVPFLAGTTKKLPDPTFRDGILTDYIICGTEENKGDMVGLIRSQRAVPQVNQLYAIGHHLFAFPSMPVTAFKDWCEEQLGNSSPVADYANGDDSSSWSSAPGDDLGDAVAFERNAEAQVLDMHRVVNMVYDSQGASVNLKIGADAIREAIRALEGAFNGRRIRKHDLVRVLTANLRRLRAMYGHFVGGEMVSSLNLDLAVQLLHELCEYEENETDLEELLQQNCAQQRRQLTMRTTSEPFPEQDSDTPLDPAERVYDFQCVSQVALNHLLPREALAARLAWRVGFVAGLENVGKTLILNSLQGVVQPTIPTVGLSRRVMAFEEWVFEMNELGGRESFCENWRLYVERMEAVNFILFVVDSINKRSFKRAAAYLRAITDHFTTAPLVIIFNNYRIGFRGTPSMQDLEAALKLDRVKLRGPRRLVLCTACDITVVSSSHRTPPRYLLMVMCQLSRFMRGMSRLTRQPKQPKPDSNAEAMMMQLSSSVAWRV